MHTRATDSRAHGSTASIRTGPNAGNLAGGMAASRIIADEIRASKRRGSAFGGKDRGEEEGSDDDEGDGDDGWGGVQDIHDLNNPFDLLGEEDEGEDN